MLTVTKEFSFCAAHHLPGHPTCGKVHGHNYRVLVTFEGDDTNDMVIDFQDIKAVVEPILKMLDHADLNTKIPTMPTAENIAKFLYGNINYKMFSKSYIFGSVKLLKVTIYETPTSCATYRR